ncbi:MAG: DUF1232 domain-containing protein [Bacteroidaceae bacterium]|nr:DUF1232 domain-containing protein [Bacteroidaceae bacterium]
MLNTIAKYQDAFTEEGMWDKLSKFAKKGGRKFIENVLILWYAFPDASAKDKAIIIGAIGYFISPLDVIPDFVIGGLSDDIGVVAWAVARVRMNASASAIQKAKQKTNEYFQ